MTMTLETLSHREREIVVGIASHGWSADRIAASLGVSRSTVIHHTRSVFRKIGIDGGNNTERKRVALVMWAWRQPGWRELDDQAQAETRSWPSRARRSAISR